MEEVCRAKRTDYMVGVPNKRVAVTETGTANPVECLVVTEGMHTGDFKAA